MVNVTKKTSVASRKPAAKKEGWQAEKSAMTRNAILEAAIQCFIDLGYANTTTALIAEYAGVSRGAMMHHFPSRASVLKATIEYLHDKRLTEFSKTMSNIDDPEKILTRDRVEQFVKAAWEYVNQPFSIAFMEVLMASRSDEELREVLDPLEKEYEKQFLITVKAVFPHWQDLEILETANDIVHFMLSGMALNQIKIHKQSRTTRILNFLTESLETLYTSAVESKGSQEPKKKD